MVARVQTVAFAGIEVLDVDVQVQVSSGLPAFTRLGFQAFFVQQARQCPLLGTKRTEISGPQNVRT
jgi:magnesium chelatase family protein|tara:strand:+ start:338 stop:535 length:198 start_codon:yes stop_codon:yes gene_type:complete